ncbi:hypothetical protein E2C01_065651 [Portunus trituberculatus]|uniref:Uncharacterized protein n=1 Tax=Portunus trituberculatus TaxID=210409 RepID=A0A5B7HNZ7_PORTR|nr:hypothetical protein [Portunus trituberculatus]
MLAPDSPHGRLPLTSQLIPRPISVSARHHVTLAANHALHCPEAAPTSVPGKLTPCLTTQEIKTKEILEVPFLVFFEKTPSLFSTPRYHPAERFPHLPLA